MFPEMAEGAAALKMIRLIRLLRLAKLLKVLRASRILNRWATRISITFAMQTLIKCFIMIVVAAHW